MKAVCFDIPLGAGNIAFVILFFQIVVNEINSQYNFILQSHFSKWHSKMELVLFLFSLRKSLRSFARFP